MRKKWINKTMIEPLSNGRGEEVIQEEIGSSPAPDWGCQLNDIERNHIHLKASRDKTQTRPSMRRLLFDGVSFLIQNKYLIVLYEANDANHIYVVFVYDSLAFLGRCINCKADSLERTNRFLCDDFVLFHCETVCFCATQEKMGKVKVGLHIYIVTKQTADPVKITIHSTYIRWTAGREGERKRERKLIVCRLCEDINFTVRKANRWPKAIIGTIQMEQQI